MEINLKQLSTQVIENTTTEKKMSISKDKSSFIFKMFTESIYSNPIGTVAREITSNCFDSHIEANVNAPVVIKKSVDKQTNTTYISFIDYGVGMSPDRIENIYGVYFESTKRSDNTQIGGFGIGGKTPLAYKRYYNSTEYDNSFYVITIHNKTKYYYCIYEGNESPVISLLHSEATKEHNGTEIRIPILDKDIPKFEYELTRQLYYFENIIFEGFENNLSNDYQIIRGKSFLYRGNSYDSNVHVCLGKVAYPINYSNLNLNSSDFQFPVAIRFEIGDLPVTTSREELTYTENSIKLLKNKLLEVKNEICELLVKQYDSIVDLEDYFRVKNKFGHLHLPNGSSFYVGNVIKFKDVSFNNFKYNFLKMPNDKQMFNFFFENRLYGKKENKGRSRRSRYQNEIDDKSFNGGYEQLIDSKNIYYYEDDFQRKVIKQAWLKSIHSRYYMVSKKNILDKNLMSEVADLFNVHDSIIDINGLPTTYALDLLKLQDEFFNIIKNYCPDYNGLEVPEDFAISRKRMTLTSEIRNTTIPVKLANHHGRGERVKLDSLFKLKCPIFYGVTSEEETVNTAERLYKILFNENHVIYGYNEYSHQFKHHEKGMILFMTLSQVNVKYMKYCHNAIHISQFKNKMLYRKENIIMDYFKSTSVVRSFGLIKSLYLDGKFELISKEWAAKINDIRKYITNIEYLRRNHRHLSGSEYDIRNYFNLDNIVIDAQQKEIMKNIDEVLEMQGLNDDVVNCFNIPYNLSYASTTLINLLKKTLVF